MERMRNKQASLFLWIVITAFLSQNLVIPVVSETFKDQKNYYSPDPGSRTPPRGSHGSPPHGSTPSHGTPPSHRTPSHGGGGSYNPTPSTPSPGNCGTPPLSPTPTTPTPSTPPSGGGGYYYPPPSTTYVSPPPSPVYVTPPTTPINPGTPTTPGIPTTPPTVPTPPFLPDPGSNPGTCNYWSTHPTVIWGLLGWWGTLGSAFGVGSGIPGFGPSMSLPQALSNTRTDGIGALYREGTASWLNSMVNNRFPFTTTQVRDSFVAALGSNKAAAHQAQVFKMANEGRLKPRT